MKVKFYAFDFEYYEVFGVNGEHIFSGGSQETFHNTLKRDPNLGALVVKHVDVKGNDIYIYTE